MRASLIVVALLAVGCGGCGKTAGGSGADGSTTTAGKSTVDQSECAPARLGLPNAKPVTLWKRPESCAPKGGSGTHTVKSEAELAAHFDCKGPSGIDFTQSSLVVSHRMMSPAFAGNDVLDDGAKVTVVNKFRSSCPNEPPPMPAPYTLLFLLPAGGERTFGEATCKVAYTCP